MAWNDVYQNDNAVQLSITIGGRKYSFGNGVDIKVERKIGDTLNKFSLGIIDDGSNDYIEFERIVVNRFVNLEIAYGNNSKSMSYFTGFVVDYQPVFLGTSSKLTVTGYVTRKQKGLPDQSSPYLYYIDWAPVVGARRDITKDWDDIYNGTFSFTSDIYGNKLKDKPVDDNGASAQVIKSLESDMVSIANSFVNTYKNKFLDKLKVENEITKYWSSEDGEFVPKEIYFMYDETTGLYDITGFHIVSSYYEDGTPIINPDAFDVSIGAYDPDGMGSGGYDMISTFGKELLDNWKAACNKIQKYSEAIDSINNITANDTYGNAVKNTFGIGHVPWDYTLLDTYEGNILFQKYEHPQDKRRSIGRVIPDIFIEWDKDIPMSGEYMDANGRPRSGSIDEFPDDVINDIKVFGLQYAFNSAQFISNGSNDPYKSFTLLEDDIHKVKRVYTVGDTHYIWVGDCPDLYEKWKNNNWKYSEKNERSAPNMIGAMGNGNAYGYSGADGRFAPRDDKSKRPESGNKFYNPPLNKCITTYYNESDKKRYPIPYRDEGCKVLPNCVGYACGRFNEIIGEMRYDTLNCNAENFIERAESAGLEWVSYPTLGGIMVWSKGSINTDSDGAGHVAVVERLNSNGSILTSESGYGSSSIFWTTTRSGENWGGGSKYKFRGCIVNPKIGKVTNMNEMAPYLSTGYTYAESAERYTYMYKKNTEYKVGQFLIFDKYTHGKVEQQFSTGDKANKDTWAKEISEGKIREFTEEEWDSYRIYGEGNKTYKITALEANEEKGIKAMTVEQRVTQYLQSAYRSAMPLNYGEIYISDIVAQLCVLEGWKDPQIVATKASSYKSSFLNMNGMGALEYISQQLCPNAIEDGATGRSGFQCYFDTKGRFHFEPVDVNGKNSGTIISLGYNIEKTPVLSFTVRSRGQILMLGIDENYDGVNNLRGDTISISPDRATSTMSSIERELGGTASFFNLSLYNYYGYNTKSKDDYKTFSDLILRDKGIGKTTPYGTNLIRRSYQSSISSSTAAATTALQQLQKLRNVSIQAELTMIGDNTIVPGKYIQVNNYSRKGFHYTTGKYYVKTITDTVTSSGGFTQSLELYRWSETVDIMNSSPETSKKVSIGIVSKGQEALDAYNSSKGNFDKFDKWLNDNKPIVEETEVEEKVLIHTFDCNGGYMNRDGQSVSTFTITVKPGEFIPNPGTPYRYSKSNGVNLPMTNYVFKHWYLPQDGENTAFDFNKYIVAAGATFKAKWEENITGSPML